MTVVSLAAIREERQPHWEGPVKCVGCAHEWNAVGRIGTLWLDCPSCGMAKGHPKHPFGASSGDLVFACKCGSEAMTAYKRDGRFWFRCMGCGADHTESIFG